MRIGIVGLGRAAAQMLPSILAHPDVVLSAAADPNPDARARFERDYGLPAFGDAQALCARGGIDAVYVATPHERHAADTVAAAAARKHVLVEKPMALSLAECRSMTEAAARAGVVLLVGHTHGFDPAVLAMRAIVQSGELGAVRQLMLLNATNFLYRPRRPEELDRARGGGVLVNQIPHQIEIARTIVGRPLLSVRAVAGAWDPARPVEGALSALLIFAGDVSASLWYSGYDGFDSDELHGWIGEFGEPREAAHGAAKRALRGADAPEEARRKTASGFAGRGALQPPAAGAHQPHFGFLLVSCERGDLRPSADGVLVYGEDGMREHSLPPPRAYPNKDTTIDAFYRAVVHAAPVLHDGVWATQTIAAMLAIAASARERREVVLDEVASYA